EKLKVKKKPIQWTEADQETLDTIVKHIEDQTLLNYPDVTQPFTLETDASDLGVGAVLTQKDKLIGLYSCKFLPAETRYTTIEKEFLGIVKALKHFKTIIYNTHIKIKTDHANLLFNTPIVNNRVQRWKLLLEEYDYEIEYQKGEANIAADGLSRICLLHSLKEGERGLDDLIDLEALRAQQEDLTSSTIAVTKQEEKYGLWTDLDQRIVIPPTYAKEFLSKLHVQLGHIGEKNLYYTLRDVYNIEHIKDEVHRAVKACYRCQMSKRTATNLGEVSGGLSTDTPFQDISMDIYGPVSSTPYILREKDENLTKLFFLTITDRCTRFSEVYLLKTLRSDEIIEIIQNRWVRKWGKPQTILTDNGRQFISSEFNKFTAENGIQQKNTCAYNPTANSISERINQTLTKILIGSKGHELRGILKVINRALQQVFNRSIGAIPAQLVGAEDQTDILGVRPKIDEKKRAELVRLRQEQDTIRTNAKRKRDYKFKVGQTVKWLQPRNLKTDDYFIGPFYIKEIWNKGNSYLIEN
ncbi:hypothetical protein PAEPH01_2616, partial [Pancytospora epiphaga]